MNVHVSHVVTAIPQNKLCESLLETDNLFNCLLFLPILTCDIPRTLHFSRRIMPFLNNYRGSFIDNMCT